VLPLELAFLEMVGVDGLVEVLGGHPAPAAGFALGLDRIVSRLKERDQRANAPAFVSSSLAPVDVFLAQLGEVGRKKALALFEEFRRAGILVGEAFSKSSIKAQMELANRRGAKWAIVVGQKEVLDGTAIIRDMDAGTQEIVDAKKVVHEVKKKLGL
jgi:histidyl-tRNA synthetase